jgi:dihydroneopterin aldolase/2-amino-4-hydroxy-6-hydroxymethyldihydropteridine diphosphokinase/dihydropteroate synthase
MATLNVTPDSFSDGGQHASVPSALSYVQSSIEDGAGIIDIGGYSTRPRAPFVSEDEELARVIPIIRAIRASGIEIPISIDTFRPAVARAAVKAGADIINDITALSNPDMLSTARELDVPCILMHSRGDAASSKSYDAYKGGVVEGVIEELGEKVRRAKEKGLKRWNLIADPGVGFSKKVEDNLTLIRSLSALTSAPPTPPSRPVHASLQYAFANSPSHSRKTPLHALPTLLGSSRKSFLGTILGDSKRPAETRDWATATTVAAAVGQGANIVRVHNVKAMRDVVRVAERLWRR